MAGVEPLRGTWGDQKPQTAYYRKEKQKIEGKDKVPAMRTRARKVALQDEGSHVVEYQERDLVIACGGIEGDASESSPEFIGNEEREEDRVENNKGNGLLIDSKLEYEIREKRRQMMVLEQRIIEHGKASVANTSLVDMRKFEYFSELFVQTDNYETDKLKCNEKDFELEVIFNTLTLYETQMDYC
ncbi:hypothetical protein Sjap_004691 [Stephania japonica]|uniref:Uncharacterized protein n=1 Tax=Stephania japonica TaxID=461633 RepID=A0AAP0PH80_9MAGN